MANFDVVEGVPQDYEFADDTGADEFQMNEAMSVRSDASMLRSKVCTSLRLIHVILFGLIVGKMFSKSGRFCQIWWFPWTYTCHQYALFLLHHSSVSQIKMTCPVLITLEMARSVFVNFLSLVTTCVGLQEEDPQTTLPMSFTWGLHIAASMLMGH